MESGVTTRRTSKRISSSSVADTIEVKQKPTNNAATNSRRSKTETTPLSSNSPPPGPNRPSAGKGKEPVEQVTSEPEDDDVEEWEFEDDMHESDFDDEDVFSDDDAKSIISLSSEISAPEQNLEDLSPRPWRDFDHHARRQYELMFSNITAHPMHGTWDFTEDYQREKDIEMLRYMEDFALKNWVIPQEDAEAAYYRLRERTRWRSMGTRIYGPDRQPPHPQSMPRLQQPVQNGPVNSGSQQNPLQFPQQDQQNQQNQQPNPLHMNQQGPAPGQAQRMQPTMGPPQAPPGVLQSQPYGQIMHPMQRGQPPPGMGRPVGPPMTYSMPASGYIGNGVSQYGPFPGEQIPKPRQSRGRKETPAITTPPPPPRVPPYENRTKPSETRKGPGKAGRKPARRQAEAEEFPWTRQLNYPEEKANAKWDMSIYDAVMLEEMRATRLRNGPIIEQIDSKLQETQRIARTAKKNREKSQRNGEISSDVEQVKKERKKRAGQPKGETGGDPYHSGTYTFASEEVEKIAHSMGFASPDEAIEAGMKDKLDPDKMFQLIVLWNPGKKGMTENLEQARFTIRDNVLTRKQLDKTPVLTKRAAECIIDFCPDMLWRGMLLRVCSEGGHGNKDVRDRFCLNGCYCDKATITKRISAALGQKQVQPKSKGYQDGELEWYEENVKDFTHYIDYFGMRTSHRNMLKIQLAGDKRRAKYGNTSQGPASSNKDPAESSSEAEVVRTNKRAKTGSENPTSETNNTAGEEESEDARDEEGEVARGHESGEETDDSNAVSMQDSDILDRMDED